MDGLQILPVQKVFKSEKSLMYTRKSHPSTTRPTTFSVTLFSVILHHYSYFFCKITRKKETIVSDCLYYYYCITLGKMRPTTFSVTLFSVILHHYSYFFCKITRKKETIVSDCLYYYYCITLGKMRRCDPLIQNRNSLDIHLRSLHTQRESYLYTLHLYTPVFC